jgi:hypothetical protein
MHAGAATPAARTPKATTNQPLDNFFDRIIMFSNSRSEALRILLATNQTSPLSLPDWPIGRRTNAAFYGISYARVEAIPERKAISTMAQKVTTHLVDDLTGDTIEDGHGRTVSFSFDGRHYEIDLTDDNADALREAFSDYVAAARKISGRSGRASAGSPKRSNSEELAKIREWAKANGHEVSSRGRISQAVRDAYDAAH